MGICNKTPPKYTSPSSNGNYLYNNNNNNNYANNANNIQYVTNTFTSEENSIYET